ENVPGTSCGGRGLAMKGWLILVVLALFGLGCSGSKEPPAGPPTDPIDVYEALIRHQLGKGHPVEQGVRQVVYVKVPEGDPTPELLKRFEGEQPELRPVSKLVPRKSVMISIDRLEWIDRDTVEAEGGHNSK